MELNGYIYPGIQVALLNIPQAVRDQISKLTGSNADIWTWLMYDIDDPLGRVGEGVYGLHPVKHQLWKKMATGRRSFRTQTIPLVTINGENAYEVAYDEKHSVAIVFIPEDHYQRLCQCVEDHIAFTVS